MIGLASDPVTLKAIASANYSGTSNWGTSESGDLITSTGTPAHFDVNFTDETLTGTVTLANTPYNASQLISYPVTGAITGNSFSADVDVNASDLGVSAISAVTLNGGFFGANAETLAGFAHGVGGSSTRATNTFYLWVEASKQ